MKYKNIVFDVGGVLLSYRWLGVVMETIPDRDEATAFATRLYDDPLWQEFDIELRPYDEIVEEYVRKHPEDEKHIRYVLGHVERMPLRRERVWKKIHELKETGYRLYLLSNYSSRMFHAHTDGLPFINDMDGHIISYETHHLKPHKEIYEDLFNRYSLDPSECFFFDDRQENVDAGRKYGMEGRVIYSEDTLLGYLDRLLFPDGISNTFHDVRVSRRERVDWLISEMTPEEKIQFYSHPERGVGRLGVEGFVLGGEAAHGVEARNEQNGIGEADVTTSFPNPIGMSSSWDTEMIKKAGEITGIEARACYRRHRKTGLSRWAPTVDMERDPRWGRNEEGYGEDPYLTASNAAAYIEGMRGDDPEYIRCGATLKHYYANNTEKNRFFVNSSVGIRDKYEYYLPPFIKAIKNAGALGVMAAYNRINGVPGMTDHTIQSLLKDKCGLTHAVSDGFAMVRLKDYHHEYGTLAECIASSVKAGVDSMSDKPEDVEKALRDAMELSLISDEDLDGAIRNILMAEMKLGIFDPYGSCPYDRISADETDTDQARDICRRISEESLVLLENKNILPLDKKDAHSIALVGPLADEWNKDWYAGEAPFYHTVREGIELLLDRKLSYARGLDIYRIYTDDKAWCIEEDDTIGLTDKENGELFYIEDWGEGYHTIRSVSKGKYIQSLFYGADKDEKGILKADREDVFDWFTTCRFLIRFPEGNSLDGGKTELYNRFAKPVSVTKDGCLKADDNLPLSDIRIEKVTDGIKEAMECSKNTDTVILVLGCNPLIPAREDYDRTALSLPFDQQRLLEAFTHSEKKVITVLLTNYPYTMNGAEKKTDALLISATGSEYMGDAVAAALFGMTSPAGRLTQGWPVSEKELPDINDYRIIGKRTYRYISKGWMYPFGYGRSYGVISYADMKVYEDGVSGNFNVSLKIENTGNLVTDEVVQIYATADFEDEKLTGTGYGRRLTAYKRIKDISPGEIREVRLIIDRSELQMYDVVAGKYFVYGGTYHIYAGYDALNEALSCDMEINGSCFEERDLSQLTPVYACDDYENTEFVKGAFGMTAAGADLSKGSSSGKDAVLTFSKCRLPENAEKVLFIVKSERAGSIDIIWNGEILAKWSGNTVSCGIPFSVYELPTENTAAPDRWQAGWEEKAFPVSLSDIDLTGTMMIKIKGDVKIISVKIC